MTGKVKFWHEKKGYGFLVAEGQPHDLFVHYSDIKMQGRKNLKENDNVSFDLGETERGAKAINVSVI